MSQNESPGQPPKPTILTPPRAKLRRPRFQVVWLIPIIAAIIAGYLGYRTALEQGPLLTLTFDSAEGLQAGQTQVKYKAVALGTVESIDLARDNSHVVVKVRMNHVGARFLTSHARFWVERPRFNLSDVSGIETLVSGAYIAVDPGKPGGTEQTSFVGLEEPPGVRSDEPGSTYVLTTNGIGSLNSGSPVYYRDVQVGEVLGYDMGNGLGPVKVTVFIRAPFDHLVRPGSQFWNISGITLGTEGGVLQLQLQSLQALVAGGIAFALPDDARGQPPSPDNATFTLYPSEQAAKSAAYHTQIKLVTYLDSDVSGLVPGAPVQQLGVQIGVVTGVSLEVDEARGTMRVRVDMQVQPERIHSAAALREGLDAKADLQRLVDNGMRAELGTGSLVTGQKLILLTNVPGAAPAKVTREGDALVIPSVPGGLDAALGSLNEIAAKLDKMPFQQIGDNLNKLLVTANGTLGGPQLKDTLTQLQQTLKTAKITLSMLNQGYGTDSDFERGLQQLLQQGSAAAQSVKSLADYLDAHPQSLLLGRSR